MNQSLNKIDYFVISTLIILTFLSTYGGYVNADGWTYLHLAQSISNGDGLTLNDEYFAVFPLAYPVMISVFSLFSTDINILIIASKILNLTLLLATYFFSKKIFKKDIIACFFVLSPCLIQALFLTLSEALFYMSLTGVIYFSLDIQKKISFVNLGFLAILSVVCVLTKYASCFFIFAAWLCLLATYGVNKKTIITLIPFSISATFFAIYLYINYKATGNYSGMERAPVLESFKYIAYTFLLVNLKILIPYSILAYILCVKTLRIKLNHRGKFLILFGIFYGGIYFILRTMNQFDLFGLRINGFGISILFSGLIYSSAKELRDFKFFRFFIFLAISIASVKLFPMEKARISKFHIKESEYKYMISIKTMENSKKLSSQFRNSYAYIDKDEYYGYDVKIIPIYSIPYNKQDSLKSLKERLSRININECSIDFSLINNIKELDIIISAKYQIDVFPTKKTYVMSEEIQDKLRQVFTPNTLVPCNKIIY